jgi:hypothetical protein
MSEMDQIKVLLVGGPAALREADRIRVVDTLVDKIKLLFGNSYEHFAYSGESHELNGSRLPVFRWCSRTKIAE